MEKEEKTVEQQFEEKVNDLGLVRNKLKEAGFTYIPETLDKVERIQLAYKNYPSIAKKLIDEHNKKLRKATEIESGRSINYKRAELIDLKDFKETPPTECLDAIIEARKTGIFDNYKLLQVVWTEEKKRVPDPIVFGVIDGLKDEFFFITQWDEDITLEELLD